jgi:CRISPR-associated protein Cas1
MHGQYHGKLSSGSEDVDLLMMQMERYQDSAFRLGMARAIVEIKIRHQQRVLQRYARNHPDSALTHVINQLGRLMATLPDRLTVPAVMGVEGQAAAVYFSVFGHCLLQEGVVFTDRNRRPPKDPVNAILSLGYMLVLGEVLSALEAQGLHSGIGFLHEVSPRRPALALDILELARQPIADRLTLSLFNRRVLTPGDFHSHTDGGRDADCGRDDASGRDADCGRGADCGVRLSEKGLKQYLHFYERAMSTPFRYGADRNLITFREWLREQVVHLKAAMKACCRWEPTPLEL